MFYHIKFRHIHLHLPLDIPGWHCVSEGSVEVILDQCANYWNGTSIERMDNTIEKTIYDFYLNAMTKDLQCVAYAFKPMPSTVPLKRGKAYVELEPPPSIRDLMCTKIKSSTKQDGLSPSNSLTPIQMAGLTKSEMTSLLVRAESKSGFNKDQGSSTYRDSSVMLKPPFQLAASVASTPTSNGTHNRTLHRHSTITLSAKRKLYATYRSSSAGPGEEKLATKVMSIDGDHRRPSSSSSHLSTKQSHANIADATDGSIIDEVALNNEIFLGMAVLGHQPKEVSAYPVDGWIQIRMNLFIGCL